MEVDFDAGFVEADEEPLGTLVERKSKVDRGRNLKENVANDTLKPEMNSDFVTSGGQNININEAINLQDEAANQTCTWETKMNMNFTACDEEFSSSLVLNTSELNTGGNLEENIANGGKIMSGNIKIGFNKVQNSEVKPGGKSSDAEQSQVTTVELEHTERHENKDYINGGSTAYSLSMDPSNKSAVLTDMPITHLKAKLEPSVHYAEDKGLWKCRHCSWVYPGTNPGIEFIEKHKEHCEGMNNENIFFEHVFPIKHEFQKGSQINANLGRGSETIDYESKETEFVTSEMVSQTMTQKRNDQEWPTTEGIWQSYYTDSETSTGAHVTQSSVTGKFNLTENINNGKSAFLDSQIFPDTGSTATVRNGGPMSNNGQDKTENSGIKEHQHWNGVSKTVLQKSQDGFVGAKDEKQLRENQIRILEKHALEGEVEDIVKILKEQQSHDLICPNCGSCITKRVILRKRKRTSLVSEGNTDVQVAVSEEEHEITEDQSNRPEMSIEHGEETEAYGCLTCFSLFFIRGVKFFCGNNSSAEQYASENLQDSRTLIEKEKDSFRCFSFLYPWGHSTPGEEADYAIETSQRKSGKQAESIPNTMPSESNLGMADTLHQKPATSIGSGSLLKNDGVKTTTVNVVGLDEDHTVAENVKLDPRMNVSDKDDVKVKEFTEKLPNQAASHQNLTIQNIRSHTSTTTKSTHTYSSRMGNVEIKETNYITTETTKSTPYLDGDSESLQAEEQYLRHPDLEITEGQFTIPPSSSSSTLNDKIGQAEAMFDVPIESVSEKESDMHVQRAYKLAESKHLEQQHVYHKDVKGTEDQLREVSKGMSDMAGNKELPRSEHQPDDLERNRVVGKGQIDKKDYLCSCIPVSIPTFWSWSSKELIADEQLKKPLLPGLDDRQTVDKEAPVELGDESRSSLETLDPATLVQRQVGDSIWLNKVGDSVSQSSEISPDSQNIVIPSDGRSATVINIVQTDDSQQENTGTSVSELSERPKTEVTDLKVVTDWDLLKSIVYGGLTVSVTSLGVVSSAAGGEAKTLTVIAISLANLVAGFFLIITNILYLGRFHENEFKATVGHAFWFNGFIAILSYLIFGSLAPITYGFSFQKSDDTMYKFLAASLVSLISIILLALGKARVSKPENPGNPVKRYIQTVILYVVTGFWASIIGFFAGKYIKKLLEKWGFTTD